MPFVPVAALALERVHTDQAAFRAVLAAGYKLADSDGYEVTQAPEGTTAGRPHPSNRPCRR
jgi:hypothetical protein